MQKLQGSLWCYSNLSTRMIQPSFDAQWLCMLHSDCTNKSTYVDRWSLDGSLAGACCMSTAGSWLSFFCSVWCCVTPVVAKQPSHTAQWENCKLHAPFWCIALSFLAAGFFEKWNAPLPFTPHTAASEVYHNTDFYHQNGTHHSLKVPLGLQ